MPNGSPYYRNKYDTRVAVMVARVVETGLPLVYLNMVGGQDDQVFDGGSFVLAIKEWRARFDVAERNVTVSRLVSGYRAAQVADAAGDAARVHREFCARWPR